jgi:N-acetylglucosamine-6-phosphate deacetylase
VTKPASSGRCLVLGDLLQGGDRVPGTVAIEDGVLVDIFVGRRPHEHPTEIYDLPGGLVLPGLIDMHIHGGGGYSTTGGADGLRGLGRWLASRGVTGFVASVAARPQDELTAACRAVAEAADAGAPPNLLGLHLEGPFLNPERAGALLAQHFRTPSYPLYRALRAAAGPWLRVLTIAPELPDAGEIIAACRRDGVVAAMGHTSASFEEAVSGISAGIGITHVTHLFNAMSPFHHRSPGAVGAALTSHSATAELIADGQHLHAGALALARRALGSERLVLVSDALPAAGMCQASSTWDGRQVFRRGHRLVLADGTLAGSALHLNEILASAIAQGLPVAEAVAMATANPAAVLGLERRKGRLLPGQDADIVVVDHRWQPILTLIRGRRFWPEP